MFDAGSMIEYGGLLLLLIVVYVQTGLFFCFFLPGGGLMFAAGVLVATGVFPYNLLTTCSLLILANILGNLTGYFFGYKAGPRLAQREDKGLFQKKHLSTAASFYEKHGALALSAGVFLPIIRTFSPIVCGMIRTKFRRFIGYVSLGSVAYVLCFVLSGYLIGSMPFLKPYLKYLVTGIVLVVTLPIVIRIVREFRKKEPSGAD